ncbi:hypothetical protein [Knoellia sp. Soil729]|uniref:hypothetical protein n=1 Tax=Knoellia sp. Soil729 TaxID=1736394 RepID=UPI0006F26A5A|nr:hypothetical protein [Knoellia sp. Soil729]KRE41071.1 hypothetical protein ASG74_14510 [Knoellia sp. Soil729]
MGRALAPIEGNADSVRRLAAALSGAAARLSAINDVLVTISSGASWQSPAGEVFEAAVRESPPLVDALIDRYAGSAGALRTFAEALDSAQRRAVAAGERYLDAWADHEALQVQLDAQLDDPVARADLERRQRDALARMHECERVHACAWEDFREADTVLARRLRSLSDDILADSWHYTAFARGDEAVASMEASFQVGRDHVPFFDLLATKVPGGSQAAAGTAAVGGVSRAALALFYDEGSVGDVAVGAATALGVRGGSALVKGSTAGAGRTVTNGRRVITSAPTMTTVQRVRAGAREQWAQSQSAFGKKVDLSRPDVPAKVSGALPLRERARQLARDRLDRSQVGQFRLAAAGGAGAKRMFVAGATLEKALPRLRTELVTESDGTSSQQEGLSER